MTEPETDDIAKRIDAKVKKDIKEIHKWLSVKRLCTKDDLKGPDDHTDAAWL